MAPGREDSADAVVDLVMRSIHGREARIIAHEGAGGIDGLLVWSLLPWDSSITGIRCSRISLLGGEGLGDMLSAWREVAGSEGVEYTTARLPCGDECHGARVESLKRAGFTRLEEIVYLSAPTGRTHDAPADIEQAQPGDMEMIREVARRSFSFDRFHSEPLFSREVADSIHEEWARNSFAGRADVVLMKKGPEGWPVGYCTVIVPDMKGAVAGWIDMLAVRPGEREKGKGRRLVKGAFYWLKARGIAEAALCTQSGNLPALGLYNKTGFREYATAETWSLRTTGQGCS